MVTILAFHVANAQQEEAISYGYARSAQLAPPETDGRRRLTVSARAHAAYAEVQWVKCLQALLEASR